MITLILTVSSKILVVTKTKGLEKNHMVCLWNDSSWWWNAN